MPAHTVHYYIPKVSEKSVMTGSQVRGLDTHVNGVVLKHGEKKRGKKMEGKKLLLTSARPNRFFSSSDLSNFS